MTPTPSTHRTSTPPNNNYTPKTTISTDSNPKSKQNNFPDSKGSDVAVFQSIDATPAATFFACQTYATAFKEEIMPAIAIIWIVSTAAPMSHVEFAATINIVLDVLFNVVDICPYAFFWIV